MALLLIATTIELAAAWLSVTVHVLDALLPKLEGAQDNAVSCAAPVAVGLAVRLNDCDPPL